MRIIKKLIKKVISTSTLLLPKPLERQLRSIFHYLFHKRPIRKRKWTAPDGFPSLNGPVLIIGHANFLKSTGGTEYAILQHAEQLISNNKDFVYLCPQVSTQDSTITFSNKIQIIANGHHFGTIPINQVLNLAIAIAPSSIVIHHILRWPLSLINKLISESKAPTQLHIHDFLIKCPLINYRCMSGERLCNSRFASWYISRWRNSTNALLSAVNEIIVPSKFVYNTLPKELLPKTKVVSPQANISEPKNKRTLAFLGYSSAIKGYDIWEKLASNALVTRSLTLIHVGDRHEDLPYVPSIKYSFAQNKHSQATEILIREKVDAVLLWSQVPETFSFTLSEAINADCFIITNPNSGNIAFTVKNELLNRGIVIDNEYLLTIYLLKNFCNS